MTRRQDAEEPDPPGGHAAERLRDFLSRRRGGEPLEPPREDQQEPETEQDATEDDTGR